LRATSCDVATIFAHSCVIATISVLLQFFLGVNHVSLPAELQRLKLYRITLMDDKTLSQEFFFAAATILRLDSNQ